MNIGNSIQSKKPLSNVEKDKLAQFVKRKTNEFNHPKQRQVNAATFGTDTRMLTEEFDFASGTAALNELRLKNKSKNIESTHASHSALQTIPTSQMLPQKASSAMTLEDLERQLFSKSSLTTATEKKPKEESKLSPSFEKSDTLQTAMTPSTQGLPYPSVVKEESQPKISNQGKPRQAPPGLAAPPPGFTGKEESDSMELDNIKSMKEKSSIIQESREQPNIAYDEDDVAVPEQFQKQSESLYEIKSSSFFEPSMSSLYVTIPRIQSPNTSLLKSMKSEPGISLMTVGDVGHVQKVQLNQLLNGDATIEDYYYIEYANQMTEKRKNQFENIRLNEENVNSPVAVKKDAVLYLPFPSLLHTNRTLSGPFLYNSNSSSPSINRNFASNLPDNVLGTLRVHSMRRPKASIIVTQVGSADRIQDEKANNEDESFSLNRSTSMSDYFTRNALIERLYDLVRDIESQLPTDSKLILNYISNPVNMVPILSSVKGHRSLTRALRSVNLSDQQEVLESIVSYLPDVIKTAPLASIEASLVEYVLAPLLPALNIAGWSELLSLLDRLISCSNPITFTHKMTHMILVMLMGHAECLKSKSENISTSASDSPFLPEYKQRVFSIHTSLTERYDALFSDSFLGDQFAVYTWQFLALMAVNMPSEPTHSMISELREPILSAAASPLQIDQVNLLLHVIGLDASQLQR